MKMRNCIDRVLKSPDLGFAELAPGEEVEIADGYCYPMRSPAGARIPSIAERLAPGLEPADEAYREEWKKPPARNWEPPRKAPVAKELEKQGVAPGVAEIMAEKAKADSEESSEPQSAAAPSAEDLFAEPSRKKFGGRRKR
jgi:hypothetical protein